MVREEFSELVEKVEGCCSLQVGDRLLICSSIHYELLLQSNHLHQPSCGSASDAAVCTNRAGDAELSWPQGPAPAFLRRIRAVQGGESPSRIISATPRLGRMAVQTHFQLNIKGVEEHPMTAEVRRVLAATPLSACCYKNTACALQPTLFQPSSITTFRHFWDLLEQTQHSFSIPTADVEETSAVLSGSGMSIGQRAHLRDIESCISALRLAQTIILEYAIEKLLAERDRVLITPHY